MGVSLVILVAGPPASGKTTLSRRIAECYSLPLLSKDAIKIRIYESLMADGITDHAIGRAAYDILFHVFGELAAAGVNFVVESNFDAVLSAERLQKIREQTGFKSLTVLCDGELRVLHERFVGRDQSEERNPFLRCPNYYVYEAFEERQRILRSDAFDIGGARIGYDATSFCQAESRRVMDAVKEFLQGGG